MAAAAAVCGRAPGPAGRGPAWPEAAAYSSDSEDEEEVQEEPQCQWEEEAANNYTQVSSSLNSCLKAFV